MDHEMPGMDGLEAIRARERAVADGTADGSGRSRHLNAIAMTAMSSTSTVGKATTPAWTTCPNPGRRSTSYEP